VSVGEEVTVPAQHCVGEYQQPQSLQTWFRGPVQQRGQPGPVGRVEPDPLAAELTLRIIAQSAAAMRSGAVRGLPAEPQTILDQDGRISR